jgi:protein-disulfide isomerase
MKNIPLLAGTLIGSLLLVIVVVVAFSKMANKPLDPKTVLGDMKYATGSAQPKVTVVEFSDFQCPACLAAKPLVDQLLAKHNTNMRLVYRYFPLVTIHKNAQAAAEAAITAGQFNQYWPYHNLLFEKQREWADLSSPTSTFIEYAGSLGIDKQAFSDALTKQKDTADNQIAKDVQDGTTIGVNATPTFYIDNKKVEVQDLSTTVESSLGK